MKWLFKYISFEIWFWCFMTKRNVKFWWRCKFLWFFQFWYYMATDKGFRRLQREMKAYDAKRNL